MNKKIISYRNSSFCKRSS